MIHLKYSADIVIVNWNSGENLQKTLATLYSSAGQSSKLNVCVVDNNSTDDSVSVCIDGVNLICNDENKGFARAANIGAEQGNSPYIFFINPDTLFSEDIVLPLITLLNQNPRYGAVSPVIYNIKGKLESRHRLHYSPLTSFFNHPFIHDSDSFPANFLRTLYRLLFRTSLKIHDIPDWQTYMCTPVMYGSVFAIKRSVFEKIGGFDERFFLYYEDYDLFRKIDDAGYLSLLDLQVTALHLGGRSSVNLECSEFHKIRSRFQYIAKWNGVISYCFEKYKALTILMIMAAIFPDKRKTLKKQISFILRTI